MARPARLIVWDFMGEYARHAKPTDRLAEILAAGRSRASFAFAYIPPRESDDRLAARFDAFCSIALELGDLTMVCEEMQRVTRPSWAPPAWSDCTLLGGHRRLRVLAVSPRPALVDKNLFGSANIVSTCRLNYLDDVACLANVLGVEREVIARIPPYHYVARDMVSGETFHGATSDPPIGRSLGRARARAAERWRKPG